MPYEGDPIKDVFDVLILAAFGVAAYFLYELYADPESAIATTACQTLGVGCAPGVVPSTGLGAWAWKAGWWWGEASSAADNAAAKVADVASSTSSATQGGIDMIGSVFNPTPTPSVPSVGLPAGYDPTTGTVGIAPSGTSSSW